MKQKNNSGFSLVEVLVTIVILGLITIPMTSGMLVSVQTMDRAEQMMKDQLAVSSTVEKLMAAGIQEEMETEENGVKILAEIENEGDPYYKVTISCNTVEVVTYIRAVPAAEGEGDGT